MIKISPLALSLPPSLKAQRTSTKRFNPNPVALKASGGALRGSKSARRVIGASSRRLACLWCAASELPQYHSPRGSVQPRCLRPRCCGYVVLTGGPEVSTEKLPMANNDDKKVTAAKTKLFKFLPDSHRLFAPPSRACVNITSRLGAAERSFI